MAATLNAATDPRIDPQVRSFLAKINKDSSPFWELPQPKPQEILTGLQSQTAVEMSGVTTTEKTISQDGRSVKLYIMKPEQVSGTPGVVLFIHGGVWIVGNFQNHQRLLRDLVAGSGQIGVFVEYTSLPAAKFPTQLEECYAALKWVAAHAGEFGADGTRIAVAGNSVGGNMSAALPLIATATTQDHYQVLLIPATDASVDTRSYLNTATTVPEPRVHEIRLGSLRSRREDPQHPISPLRASTTEFCARCPLVITAENDPLRRSEAYARKPATRAWRRRGSLQRHDSRFAAERARHVHPLRRLSPDQLPPPHPSR